MDKRHKKIVADEAGVAERAGDVAASRISPFGPGSPEGFQDERRSARDAVAAAMVSDARNRVMAEKGDSLRAKATAAAEACKALARGIEREEMLALGVGMRWATRLRATRSRRRTGSLRSSPRGPARKS